MKPVFGERVPLSDELPLSILVTDQNGNCLYSNAAYQKLCGWSGDELIGSHWSLVIHPQDRDEAISHWETAVSGQGDFLFEARVALRNGDVVWTRHNAALVTDHIPGSGYVHAIEDISVYKLHEKARRVAEEQLFEEKERAQVTLNSIGDAVVSVDIDGLVSYMNLVAQALTGFDFNEAIGRPLSEIFQVVDSTSLKPVTNPAQRAIQSNSIVALAANTLLITKDGSKVAIEDSAAPIRNRDGVVIGAVIVFHDAQLSNETTSRMAYLAQHDTLTGLHNRNAFYERFEQSLALAKRHKKQMGLLFIDLDKFKQINDVFGHDSGDAVLTTLAGRLRSCVRSTDIICRYGGDEFAVLLSEIEQPIQAFSVAKKISKTAAMPMVVEGQNIALQLSIGVSIYPENGETAKALIKTADEAMYSIKSLKRQPTDARSGVALAENHDNWPKEWCRRKTDVQFLSQPPRSIHN
ncbi:MULTISPECIES: diguanylate cyclase [unclassified Marinobacter]|uniref:diguanylate cyclase domain-containing protein n=1 Tax=unclassified Marinobacter TaxID=83889 RepID=UPI00200D72DF|nr:MULTISPECIES: diguanylate cyclase [unclassified Marinobacter]MCL1476677.1 diguanylate cyclase [Marinobacter sp.]MCL1481134.1 diguanylate cyclase [Marinobacter sp.]MCL1485467.1 diguanylate cyclase [Marinobacter sp.]MCL1487997.1 diguanylate cyclase [Marinobacter sp.]UQG56091.1 diguanylate cyclase [Marinobacter sp. M4C]